MTSTSLLSQRLRRRDPCGCGGPCCGERPGQVRVVDVEPIGPLPPDGRDPFCAGDWPAAVLANGPGAAPRPRGPRIPGLDFEPQRTLWVPGRSA